MNIENRSNYDLLRDEKSPVNFFTQTDSNKTTGQISFFERRPYSKFVIFSREVLKEQKTPRVILKAANLMEEDPRDFLEREYTEGTKGLKAVAVELKELANNTVNFSYKDIKDMLNYYGFPIKSRSEVMKSVWQDPEKKEYFLSRIHTPEQDRARSKRMASQVREHPEMQRNRVKTLKKARIAKMKLVFGTPPVKRLRQMAAIMTDRQIAEVAIKKGVDTNYDVIKRLRQHYGIPARKVEDGRSFVPEGITDIIREAWAQGVLERYLTKKQLEVIKMRFLGERILTQAEIASELGKSRQSIAMAQKIAITRLRKRYPELFI